MIRTLPDVEAVGGALGGEFALLAHDAEVERDQLEVVGLLLDWSEAEGSIDHAHKNRFINYLQPRPIIYLGKTTPHRIRKTLKWFDRTTAKSLKKRCSFILKSILTLLLLINNQPIPISSSPH